MAILINTIREGYQLDQIKRTMTVGELIKILEEYGDDTPIYLAFDNQYTYGGINENEIEEIE